MERRTQDDERREAFELEARTARELGDKALRAVDAVLAEQEAFKATLRGSDEQIGVVMWDRMHPDPEPDAHLPGYYEGDLTLLNAQAAHPPRFYL